MNPRLLRPATLCTLLGACAGAGSTGAGGAGQASPSAADATYYVYVGAESADLIHRVKLDRTGVSIDQTTPVGEMAARRWS